MTSAAPRVGVLALQGDFREHLAAVRALGAQGSEVRLAHDLELVDALIIPGGESTTIGRLATLYGMIEPLRKHIERGMPTLGTCAGMIFLSSNVTDGDQPLVGALHASVERNAFGRQNESFEVDLDVEGLADPVKAVFIRAPLIEELGDAVEVLASFRGRPVFIREANVMATSFHPELTDDRRIHQMLIDSIEMD